MTSLWRTKKCLADSPNLLKADQATPTAKKVIEKEKLLFPENLCFAIRTHRMRENKKHMWNNLRNAGGES